MAIDEIGGLIGGAVDFFTGRSAEADRKKAEEIRRKAIENRLLAGVEDYVVDYEELDPDQYMYLDPEQEEYIELGDTALAGIQLDPAFKQAQMEALASLKRRGEQGLTLEEEAARGDIMNAAGVANRGAQEAILQQAARQGRLEGGDTLAAQLASAGQTYDQASREAMDLAAARENRALQAVLSSGDLAGKLRSQEYGEQSDAARARDLINKFNVNTQLGQQQRNVQRSNEAQQYEANLRNRAYGSNVDTRNLQEAQRTQGGLNVLADINKKKEDIANAEANRLSAEATRTQAQGQAAGGFITDLAGNKTVQEGLGRVGNAITSAFEPSEEEKQKKLEKTVNLGSKIGSIA